MNNVAIQFLQSRTTVARAEILKNADLTKTAISQPPPLSNYPLVNNHRLHTFSVRISLEYSSFSLYSHPDHPSQRVPNQPFHHSSDHEVQYNIKKLRIPVPKQTEYFLRLSPRAYFLSSYCSSIKRRGLGKILSS